MVLHFIPFRFLLIFLNMDNTLGLPEFGDSKIIIPPYFLFWVADNLNFLRQALRFLLFFADSWKYRLHCQNMCCISCWTTPSWGRSCQFVFDYYLSIFGLYKRRMFELLLSLHSKSWYWLSMILTCFFSFSAIRISGGWCKIKACGVGLLAVSKHIFHEFSLFVLLFLSYINFSLLVCWRTDTWYGN